MNEIPSDASLEVLVRHLIQQVADLQNQVKELKSQNIAMEKAIVARIQRAESSLRSAIITFS